jgi:hypothetical protein
VKVNEVGLPSPYDRESVLMTTGLAGIRIHTGSDRVSGVVVFLWLRYAPGMGEHTPLFSVKIFSFFESFFFRSYIN